MKRLDEAYAWLRSRGVTLDSARDLVKKPLPRNIGWIHTLGALLIVYLAFQVVTGILLALYYSPSPDQAYESVRYIRQELTLGNFLYSLHKAGAGFLMVTAFLHMARSYFLGAYKAPRELLWISGLLLGILFTLFAFTGQLLPFDQAGYWATVVGVRIASSAPVLGDYVRKLLTGGYGDIGATTLSRFFILHVSVLPIVFLAIVGLHLKILQRVGSAGPLSGSPEPRKTFFPSQMWKDALVSAGGALLLVVVALLVDFADHGPADPAAGSYVPRPEWYFLSHYQLLKWLPGDAQILGTFVLPNVVLVALLLLPFLDRRPERRLGRRPIVVGAGAVGTLAIVTLTAIAIAEAPRGGTAGEDESRDPVAWGRELFHGEKECIQCHRIGGEGGVMGPALDGVGRRLKTDYMTAWIRNPQAFDPDTKMPAFEGSEAELQAIVSFLVSKK